MIKPHYRHLKGYTLDPGFSTRLDTAAINTTLYKVRWDDLSPGPIGEYIEVIDHDPASNCFYTPVNLDDIYISSQQGLTPSEGNPQFHQQFVYVICMKVIEHFEHALGRKIIWNPRYIRELQPHRGDPEYTVKVIEKFQKENVSTLRVYPHGMRVANAFYDPEKHALIFGYFEASPSATGNNFPGGIVFTCLSPDIIAHEITHALLDSIHHRFIENTNHDVPAFHEGFSDIVALLQRFSIPELVEHQFTRTRGRLDEYNVMGELATQFAEALGGRGALRSAIGKWTENARWERQKPDPGDYRKVFAPHKRGAILVSAVFDAFIKLYNHKTRDLFRIASAGTGIIPEGFANPDLIKRLSNEAAVLAEHLLHVCIRALDYCPPVDITFGDYLRALITADLDIAPADENKFRLALIESFRARGIFPDRVNTLSEESLCWSKPVFSEQETTVLREMVKFLTPLVSELSLLRDREIIYLKTRLAQLELHEYLMNVKSNLQKEESKAVDASGWDRLLTKLGLMGRPKQVLVRGIQYTIDPPPIEVHKIRPTFRYGREGIQIQQVLITLSQTARLSIEGKPIVFRGGCTLIMTLDLKVAEYILVKDILSLRRLHKQIAYQFGEDPSLTGDITSSVYDDGAPAGRISFAKIHSNYY